MIRAIAPAIFAFSLLQACGSAGPPQNFPPIPVPEVLEAAGYPAFRGMNAASFRKAILRYPASGGDHTVPVGDFLAAEIARSFPPDAEVDDMTLTLWQSNCGAKGFFSTDVICSLVGEARFALYNRQTTVAFTVRNANLGGQEPGDEPVYKVGHDDKEDAFARQLRLLVQAAAVDFKRNLQGILLRQNQKLVF